MATGRPRPAVVAHASRVQGAVGGGCAGETPAPQSIQAGVALNAGREHHKGSGLLGIARGTRTPQSNRARLVMHAGRVHHKDPGCLVAQPSRLHAMGGQESEINPYEGGYNKQGGIK